MSNARTFLGLEPKPIAVLTPTAAANVDFLTTFSSLFNAYRIIGMGLLPSADDYIRLRLAAAGSADTGSNYAEQGDDTSGTTAVTSIQITNTVESTGKGGGFIIDIFNVNDATNIKLLRMHGLSQSNTTPEWSARNRSGFYFAANAASGFRLYWNSASNFVAQGGIYVYPYAKV